MMFTKPQIFRSPKLRTLINTLGANRELPCVHCGLCDGTVVAAHANLGKGVAVKSSDATMMALCHTCHSRLDQPAPSAAMEKWERRDYEERMNLKTLRLLIEMGLLVPTGTV